MQKSDVPLMAPEFRVANRTGLTRAKREGVLAREVATATFDVSGGDSGAVGTFQTGVFIPANAIITGAFIDVVTTFTDGASDTATIAAGYTGAAGAFTAAIAISDASNVWDAGLRGTKVGNWALDGNSLSQIAMASGRTATLVKVTAEKELIFTVTTAGLTAGKANIFVEYLISD